MNEQIMRMCGFGRQMDLIKQGKCPFCLKQGPFEFKNEISRAEFQITGICQECQDKQDELHKRICDE